MGLMLHRQSVRANLEQVKAVPTPAGTRTWQPIPHGMFIEQVKSDVESMGMRVSAEDYGLWNEGERMFGLLEIESNQDEQDYKTLLGIRNSHDQSLSVGVLLGNRVIVCDNLSFSGEVVIRTRHTQNVMDRLPSLLSSATSQLVDRRQLQDDRIAAYKRRELNDLYAHDLICRGIQAGVVPPSLVAKVMREWHEPSHKVFEERNVWSLFNAFTEVLKSSNPLDVPKRSMLLHGLCDRHVGLNANRN